MASDNPATEPAPIDRMVQIRTDPQSLALHVREWPGDGQAFVLVHGLASNARTWDQVAAFLAADGHRVITVDQRGHGLSDKPDDGYDFATVAEDLRLLLDALTVDAPILAGQSWGGNVALAFGALYPERAAGLAFVDGGFIDMQMRPNASWDQIAVDLRPPSLAGVPRVDIAARMRHFHPDWEEAGLEGALANFETLADGTIRPWLTLERHMTILRALWEQRPGDYYPQVEAPVVIAVAADGKNPEWMAVKAAQVAAAEAGLPVTSVHWFEETDHDIHIHRPAALAHLFRQELAHGVWSPQHAAAP